MNFNDIISLLSNKKEEAEGIKDELEDYIYSMNQLIDNLIDLPEISVSFDSND